MVLGFFSLLLFIRYSYPALSQSPRWHRHLAPLSLLGFLLFYLAVWFAHILPHQISMAIAMGVWLAIFWVAFFSLRLAWNGNERAGKLFWFWIGLALFFGHLGVGLTSLYVVLQEAQEQSPFWLLYLGRGYLLQGVFLALGMAYLTFQFGPGSNPKQALIALLLTASFMAEQGVNIQLGYGLRALAILLALGQFGKPLRLAPGETILSGATGMILLGFLLVAIHPAWRLGGLHLAYLGGLLPWLLQGLGIRSSRIRQGGFVFLILAMGARFAAEIFHHIYPELLLLAAFSLLIALGLWLWNPVKAIAG